MGKDASMRKRLYQALEKYDASDQLSVWLSITIVALIAINLVAIILESIPAYEAAYGATFHVIEAVSCVFFLTEYLVRVWACVEEPNKQDSLGQEEGATTDLGKRIRHILRPMSIIDLLAFLPFILQFLLPGLDLRFLRILRLFRVFKLIRYFSSLDILFNVLYEERKSLLGTFLIMLIVLTLAASALYVVEHEQQPDQFGSIPQAMWWAMAALTTVGYGDAIPLTTIGKILASLVTILGIGMVALPSGILAASFSEHLRQNRYSLQERIDEALEDGVLTEQEIKGLLRMGDELGFSRAVVNELVTRTSQLVSKERATQEDADVEESS